MTPRAWSVCGSSSRSVAATEAAVKVRQAALAIAGRNLARTVVRAPHDGLVVGLTTASGEILARQAPFRLIDNEGWYAVGNFSEIQLGTVRPGDCATVYSLIDRSRPVAGVSSRASAGVCWTRSAWRCPLPHPMSSAH